MGSQKWQTQEPNVEGPRLGAERVTTLVVPSPATEGGSMDVECHLFGREGAKAGVQG